MDNNFKKTFIAILVSSIIVSSIFGGIMGFWAAGINTGSPNFLSWLNSQLGGNLANNSSSLGGTEKVITIDEESAVINAAQRVSPAVVSIIITKNLPAIQQNFGPFGSDFFQQFFGSNFPDFFGPNTQNNTQGGTQPTEVGGGSGFIITPDGYVVTNKHVASDIQADYTVLTNDGNKHPAKVLARDPVSDLAILKIDGNNYPTVELGDSSNLKVGQTVIAIGNALGEFRNTVSKGVISGLSRSITAGGVGIGSETLSGVIQTDASINPGNSGGPLLNIAGQVIGINTAIVQGAQNIGFTIPINEVKNSIDSVKQYGRIVRPWLGVRYQLIDSDLAKQNKLPVDYGALIVRGQNPTDLAVISGSPADKAGLKENDIILEVNGQRINQDNTLAKAISQFKVGDTITLKVLHQGTTKDVKLTLEEMKQ